MTQFDPSTPHAHEAIALIDTLFEDRITPEQASRLQELVVNDAAIARLYVGYAHLWCALPLHVVPSSLRPENLVELPGDHEQRKPRSLSDAMVLPAVREEADAEETPVLAAADVTRQPLTSQRAWWRSPKLRAAAIVALPILVGIVLWSILRPAKLGGALVASASAVWDNAVQPPHDGQPLPAGPLQLASGLAEIRLNNGVSLVVEGPAHFQLQSQNSVALELGKMTVSVPATAHGFTIQTPSSRTVDLGTEFGVIVDDAGNTETHVIRGTVEVTPTAGGAALLLSADHAARVEVGATSAQKIECHAGNFVQDIPAIDLVDLIAGGDGTQGRSNSGIDMATGKALPVKVPAGMNPGPEPTIRGDGKFHPCPSLPLGVFIPHGGPTPDTVDAAGHQYIFPPTSNLAYQNIWPGSAQHLLGGDSPTTGMTKENGYPAPGHRLLELHANKGITFDLNALRTAHPDRPFSHLVARCVNMNAYAEPVIGAIVSDRSELWIFVDGDLRSHKLIHRMDPPFDVDVPIEPASHFLTLVVSDGGDGFDWDVVSLGDPRLK